ncbi:TnsA-like heteromeric transposase endonuclease subunit [Streptomyces olivoreticuli]|uniref:TnsA-like heteromeric transposase endonuclease subunit n=1 Tax=Streptomyces olivoreticuli TaxID=68246 RepID=UPI003CC7D2BC
MGVAQRSWWGVVRRAARAGVDAGEVFGLAYAVVARWWEGAYGWEQEEIWPRRLHQVAGGDAGSDLEWWRAVGRDAVIFPEVVAVADALLDPVMAQLVWADSGGERPRALPADGQFCRRLGERLGKQWLGPLIAVDYGCPLLAWMGSVIRLRRHPGGRPGPYARFDENPWWVRQEHRPSTMAAGLRVLSREKKAPGSGTNWRAVVPAEQRFLITNLLGEAEEQLQQLHGAQVGTTAEVARSMLEGLSRGSDLLDQVLLRVMVAAVNAGVRLDMEVAFSSPAGQVTQLSWEQAVTSVRFEELAPVSAFPVVPGRRWGPGWWWSATTGRHVVHGSAAMRTQLMLLDRDPAVTGLAGRPVRFAWRDETDGRVRSWVPQLFARYADGTGLFADCPSSPASGGARAQRAGAVLEAACARVGWAYQRLEPLLAVVAGNLRWLAGYRHPRYRGPSGLQAALVEAFAVSRPLLEGAASVGDPLQVLPVVYHALWSGQLAAGLDEPLHGGSLVRVPADGGPERGSGAGIDMLGGE